MTEEYESWRNAMWKSSKPPVYIWPGDSWFNETDKRVYVADTKSLSWIDREGLRISFPKSTRIFIDKKFTSPITEKEP